MVLIINKKLWRVFVTALTIMVPIFYLFIKTDGFFQPLSLHSSVWRECAATMLVFLCLLSMSVQKTLFSFVLLCIMSFINTALEPIFLFTVFPALIAMWCLEKKQVIQKMVFNFVFAAFQILSAIAGTVAMIMGINRFYRQDIYPMIYTVIFLICFTVLVILSCILMSEKGSKLNKQTIQKKKPAKQRRDVKDNNRLVLFSFFIAVFLLFDVVVIINFSFDCWIIVLSLVFYSAMILIVAFGYYFVDISHKFSKKTSKKQQEKT